MFGLRPDGKRLKKIDPIIKMTPYIMPKRYDAMVNFLLEAKCEGMDKFIAEKWEQGEKYNYMHIVIAALVRMYAKMPKLNRFVMNCRIFKRNSIQIAFTVKKKLTDDAGETTVKMDFKGTESLSEIKAMIDAEVAKNMGEDKKNGTDKAAKFFLSMPNFLLKFCFGAVKFFDKHGMLPKSVLAVSPFHTSCFLTNMKSIGTDFVYHHIYEFGTCGLFVAMGKEHLDPIVNDNDEVQPAKIMKLGLVIDERIADGLYNAHAIKFARKHIENPYLLEEKLDEKDEDPDN